MFIPSQLCVTIVSQLCATNTGSQHLALTFPHTGVNRRQKDNIQKEDSKQITRDELEILEKKIVLLAEKNAFCKTSTKLFYKF